MSVRPRSRRHIASRDLFWQRGGWQNGGIHRYLGVYAMRNLGLVTGYRVLYL